MKSHDVYEIRCPIHGFVALNDWERSIVEQPAFQRLRRIRQLAWTDQVYPGAVHNRFEHSLGVMHTAGLMYDAIVRNSGKVLREELSYDNQALTRNRQLVRLTALLHDLGHSPFSHASEELFPDQENGEGKYEHEQYSAAIVRGPLKKAIEEHPLNQGYNFSANDVAALLEGSATARQGLFWRDLITGQIDADRMDYLLRDAYHAGVQYGNFDLRRLIATMAVIPSRNDRTARIGIQKGGLHAAEALVIARYFMFTQVYFHKTRVAYDIHLREAMKELLRGACFPTPDKLEDYLGWDDWRVLGLLAQGEGGEHGQRLSNRNHYRLIFASNEVQTRADRKKLASIRKCLGEMLAAEMPASKSWYKSGDNDIPVLDENDDSKALSSYSSVVRNIGQSDQVLLYCRPENIEEARKRIKEG